MTILGKILTLLVFVMSLVFLGFAITINQLNKDPETKENWRTIALRNKEEAQKANDERELMRQQREEALNEKERLERQIASEKEAVSKEIAAAEQKAQRSEDLRVKAEAAVTEAQLTADAAVKELAERRKQVITLQDEIRQKNLELVAKEAEITKLKNEKIHITLQRDAYLDRLKTLEKEYRALFKEAERLREQAASGGAVAAASPDQLAALTPPPEDVNGLVSAVSPKEGLVSITIGSDDGIAKGHTLEVFRLDPEPEYLGVIRVIEVRPKEAVAKIVRLRPGKTVQAKDRVASSIMPRR